MIKDSSLMVVMKVNMNPETNPVLVSGKYDPAEPFPGIRTGYSSGFFKFPANLEHGRNTTPGGIGNMLGNGDYNQ